MSTTARTATRRGNVKPPTFRAMRLSDYEAIAALEESNGLECKPRAQWEHLWTGNPAIEEARGWDIGWVFENERGEIAGAIGSIPFTYHFGGAQYLGATGCGWVTDPAYRGFSIMLLARQLRQPGIDLQLTTTPGAAAAAVYSRLRFAAPPAGRWDRTAIWPAGVSGLFRRGHVSRWPVRKLKNGIALECRREFDSRFDGFWEELRARNPRLLLASRSKAVLEWHFKYAIEEDRLRVIAACRGDRLIAYAILLKRATRYFNMRRMLLVDYQALEPRRDISAAVVDYAIECGRRDGAGLLENAGCWVEQPRFLDRTAPFHRSLPCCTYLYSASNRKLEEALKDPTCWHPTQYDGDATL